MSTKSLAGSDGTEGQPTLRLTSPAQTYILPGAALVVGAIIGLRRGARTASMQFLAENVHRPPTTVQGWYLYNKTKNYRVLKAGLKEAGKEAGRLGTTVAVWVGLDEGCRRIGGIGEEAAEVVAGTGTAGVFAGVYRLPWKTAQRALALGVMAGATLRGLRWSRERLGRGRAQEREAEAGRAEEE